jgi:RND family efflux transporter MFP subunit
MSTRNKLLKIVVPLGIVLIGLVGMIVLISARSEPQKMPGREEGALVEILELQPESRQVVVSATGTVEASQKAEIVPQVSGRVTELASNLVLGGFFKKGDLLFRVEDIDYRLAVDRARAAVTKAEFNLAKEEGNARVARQEWERLQLQGGGDPNPLVLNEPQLNNARAELSAAGASLRQAEIDLERTRLRAPFDCIVSAKTIDQGQYVRAGSGVATVIGTATAEIVVPLPLEETAWLDIPRPGGGKTGSPALISSRLGNRDQVWSGKVSRSLSVIDAASRMARVVVEVNDPYNLAGRQAKQLTLAVGMFVEVRLEGSVLPDIIAVPRRALRENDIVWLADGDNRLRMQQVTVLRLEREEAFISEGVRAGDRLVLTNLTGAAEGMRLRLLSESS